MSGTGKKDIQMVSASFKREATKAMATIIAFIFVYLLMVIFSIGLAVLSFYAGVAIISAKASFLTLIAGLGIMAAGVMVVVFMIKFLFSSTKDNDTDSVEVTAQDHPALFAMIEELVKEIGTSRPKKVFLSRDVNACVFYHSSFWSMFLPIPKNLKIGLGLVNSLNASELRAVLAHEFGHFSQRSMKVGSWVYQVNKVIHDMLFNNSGFEKSVQTMSSLHGILSIFAMLTVSVVKAIQWVLQHMYKLVNRSYMGLSREMEFHADLVAARVCGSNNIINALRRIEFADLCYNTTLHICNLAWDDRKVVKDFYSAHSIALRYLALHNEMQIQDGLPVAMVRDDGIANRINFKNQWASHPTLQERHDYLQPMQLEASVDQVSAWTYFSNEKKWKEQLTTFIYSSIDQQAIQGEMDEAGFESLLSGQLQKVSFPRIFQSYYDSRQLHSFDVDKLVQEPFAIQPFERVFTTEVAQLPRKLQLLEQDISALTAIVNREIETRTFDFDGQKFNVKSAREVLALLEQDKADLTEALKTSDQQLFRCFYSSAPMAEAEGLKARYKHYFQVCNERDAFLEQVNAMMNPLAPIYRGETVQSEQISGLIADLKATHELRFKNEIKRWKDQGAFDGHVGLLEKVERFLAADYVYFHESGFMDQELLELNELVQDCWTAVEDSIFSRLKEIVEQQAAIAEQAVKVRGHVTTL